MATGPNYDAIVRRTIERYRAKVHKAPQVSGDIPANTVTLIAGLVAENEEGGRLFRGEARCHDHVSSSLFRKLRLTADGDNFDRLVECDRETIRAVEDTPGQTRITCLSRAQHYSGEKGGRHTNLIDMTENLPVALYFACKDHPSEDGRIVIALMETFAEKEDIDLSCRRPQRIRPGFDDDTRNIHQWSHFVYPATGVLEDRAYRTVRIPCACKAAILEHLDRNCGIRHDTIFTSTQSWFESTGVDRFSRNMHMLGVTMEWLGGRDEAQRIYRGHGLRAAHESQVRLLELEGERREYSDTDVLALRLALGGKATALYNLAEVRSQDVCGLDETERLWMKALATWELSRDVGSISAALDPSSQLPIYYRFGKFLLAQASKNNDPVLLGRAMAMLELAVHFRELHGWNGPDPILADMSHALADTERRAGMPERAARRLRDMIAIYADHPRIDDFRRLLGEIESQ